MSVNDLTAYQRSDIKNTAKWGSIHMTAKDIGKNDENVYRVCDRYVAMHRPWYSGREKVNSEQGGVWEVENCTRNVTILEGFASIGKSSVSKKEF